MTVGAEVLTFPHGSYLKISEPAGQELGPLMYASARLQRGRILAAMELVRPNLIEELLYEGMEDSEGWMAVSPEAPMVLRTLHVLTQSDLLSDISSAMQLLSQPDGEARERFALIGRWYRRAREVSDPIDRFLFLYFAVEVFPSRNAEVPNAVAEFISEKIPGADARRVKAGLNLGRIAGLRGKIVHNGFAVATVDQLNRLGIFSDILDGIVLSAMEFLAGKCCRQRLVNLLLRHAPEVVEKCSD